MPVTLVSMMFPYLMTLQSGPARFFNELVPPTGPPPEIMDPRAALAIWQLTISMLHSRMLHNIMFKEITNSLLSTVHLAVSGI